MNVSHLQEAETVLPSHYNLTDPTKIKTILS